MKIWRVQSCDHRMLDEGDEAYRCELFASSRGAAMSWMRDLVRNALHIDLDRTPDLYNPAPPSQEPVEISIECITLADLTMLPLVLACLNRQGWRTFANTNSKEIIWLDKNGRAVPQPVSERERSDVEEVKPEPLALPLPPDWKAGRP